MKILMIDNYDSFTFNLVQYLGELGAEVLVKRNDEIPVSAIEQLAPDKIMLSPGPCTPNEAGISLAVIQAYAGVIPILGVCLGHQAIGQAFGGNVIGAKRIMHGKISRIHHQEVGVFRGLSSPYNATRYHSLVVEQKSLPDCFNITAWTEDEHGHIEEIMGIQHNTLAVEGVQFHPESILTEQGHALLKNFLDQ